MALKLAVRLARLEDREQHLRLIFHFYDSLPSAQKRYACRMARRRWAWKRKSLGEDSSGDFSTFLAFLGGKAVGTVSCMPTMIKLGQSTQRGYWLQDLMVDPAYRQRGIATRLLETAALLPGVKMALGPTPVSKIIFTEKFYLRERAGLDFWACHLNSGPPLEKGTPEFRNMSLTRVQRFSREADQLYRKISRDYGFIIPRDRHYLNWRYCDIPLVGDRPYLKSAVWRGGKIEAILVLRVHGWYARAGFIEEVLLADNDDLLLEFCLREVKNIFARLGVRYVKVLLNDRNRRRSRVFWRHGFVPLLKPPGFFYSLPRGEGRRAGEALAKNPYLSSGDSDWGFIF